MAPPRSVFVNDGHRHVVVTYSDGEGSDAGVRVAAWRPEILGDVPFAGFLEVPREVRELRSRQKAHAAQHSSSEEEFRDIIETEAIGPLVMLCCWPFLFIDAFWIHIIDNASAFGGLVKGSSPVRQQDTIIGHTVVLVLDIIPTRFCLV